MWTVNHFVEARPIHSRQSTTGSSRDRGIEQLLSPRMRFLEGSGLPLIGGNGWGSLCTGPIELALSLSLSPSPSLSLSQSDPTNQPLVGVSPIVSYTVCVCQPFSRFLRLVCQQVRLAQKSIPTGLVYQQNEEVLTEVGAGELQKMLEQRDWAGLEGKKVRFLHGSRDLRWRR